jgi:hypothetical protein
MTWLEWLDWKFYLWRKRKPCRRGEHDPIGPDMCADGLYRYRCSLGCGWRIRADEVVQL